MEHTDKYKKYSCKNFTEDERFWLWATGDREQDAFWQQFLKEYPGKTAEVNRAIEIIKSLNAPISNFPEERVDRLWSRIRQSAAEQEQEVQVMPRSGLSQKSLFRIAASVVFVLGLGALFFFLARVPEQVQITSTDTIMQQIMLPDGSTISLNANSTLTYNDDWEQEDAREVWLEGEAFFEVKQTADRKRFVVHSGNMAVEVLGTSFNVKHRESDTEVVLVEGKVQLREEGSPLNTPVIMEPGELVTYAPGQVLTKKTVAPQKYVSWKDKLLVFENDSLTDIFRMLEETYGFQVSVADTSIGRYRFSGTLPADNLQILFKGLEEVHGITLTRSGDQVIVKKGN